MYCYKPLRFGSHSLLQQNQAYSDSGGKRRQSATEPWGKARFKGLQIKRCLQRKPAPAPAWFMKSLYISLCEIPLCRLPQVPILTKVNSFSPYARSASSPLVRSHCINFKASGHKLCTRTTGAGDSWSHTPSSASSSNLSLPWSGLWLAFFTPSRSQAIPWIHCWLTLVQVLEPPGAWAVCTA